MRRLQPIGMLSVNDSDTPLLAKANYIMIEGLVKLISCVVISADDSLAQE